MWQKEVEHVAVALSEIGIGSIELESSVGSVRIEIELQDVLDADRPVDEVVELGLPEFPHRDEIGQGASRLGRPQRIVVLEPAMPGPDLGRHRADRLARVDEHAIGTPASLMEGHNVARD
jgi:hypothetical protein